MEKFSLPVHKMGYSTITATLCSYLSKFSYEGEDEVKQFLQEINLELSDYFDIDGLQGFLAESATVRFLVFRGTDLDGRDLVTDLTCKKVKTSKGGVHKGFYEAFMKLEKHLEFILSDSDKNLIITGHSLGGALAIMATAFLSNDVALKLSSVYTFGAPGVCDSDLEDVLLDYPIYRFIYEQDIISRVPFWMKKPGELYFLTDSKILKGNSAFSTYLLYNLLSGIQVMSMVFTKKTGTDKFLSLKPLGMNHKIHNYVEKLECFLKRKEQSPLSENDLEIEKHVQEIPIEKNSEVNENNNLN